MGIVRRDKTLAGYNGNIESVVVHGTNGELLENYGNGILVTLGGLENIATLGREAKRADVTKADTAGEEVLMVISPELMYDEKAKLDDFKHEAGKLARAYRLYDGDILTLTADILPEGVAVDDVLVAGADGELVVATAGEYKTAFEVIEDCGNELHIVKKAFALQVVKNIAIA